MTTSSESTLADQPRDAAGIDPVQEPMYDYGSNSDDTVTERHRAVSNATLTITTIIKQLINFHYLPLLLYCTDFS